MVTSAGCFKSKVAKVPLLHLFNSRVRWFERVKLVRELWLRFLTPHCVYFQEAKW